MNNLFKTSDIERYYQILKDTVPIPSLSSPDTFIFFMDSITPRVIEIASLEGINLTPDNGKEFNSFIKAIAIKMLPNKDIISTQKDIESNPEQAHKNKSPFKKREVNQSLYKELLSNMLLNHQEPDTSNLYTVEDVDNLLRNHENLTDKADILKIRDNCLKYLTEKNLPYFGIEMYQLGYQSAIEKTSTYEESIQKYLIWKYSDKEGGKVAQEIYKKNLQIIAEFIKEYRGELRPLNLDPRSKNNIYDYIYSHIGNKLRTITNEISKPLRKSNLTYGRGSYRKFILETLDAIP